MKKTLEYHGYHARVEFDADDNILVGTVLGIADSLSFHATTVDELREMFHQSVDNYLEMCKAIGKKPDKECSGTFNVRITPELHREAWMKAQQEGITLNHFVERALERAVHLNKQRVETDDLKYIQNTSKTISWTGNAMMIPREGSLSRRYKS